MGSHCSSSSCLSFPFSPSILNALSILPKLTVKVGTLYLWKFCKFKKIDSWIKKGNPSRCLQWRKGVHRMNWREMYFVVLLIGQLGYMSWEQATACAASCPLRYMWECCKSKLKVLLMMGYLGNHSGRGMRWRGMHWRVRFIWCKCIGNQASLILQLVELVLYWNSLWWQKVISAIFGFR